MDEKQPAKRIVSKNLDWLSFTSTHPPHRVPVTLYCRTMYFFIEALQPMITRDLWSSHRESTLLEIDEICNDLKEGRPFYHNNYKYQRSKAIEDSHNGIRLFKNKTTTKIDFQGLFFLYHQKKGLPTASSFFKKLNSLFSSYKDKKGFIPPKITRIDARMEIATTEEIKELLPDFTSPLTVSGFQYNRAEYSYNRDGIEIKNAIVLRPIGKNPTWEFVIYDKLEEVSKWNCDRKKELFWEYFKHLGVKKGEKLYRAEMRYTGNEKCSFMLPYILGDKICEQEAVNLVFSQFYKRHKFRIKDKERANPSRYPTCPKWNFIFNQEISTKLPKPDRKSYIPQTKADKKKSLSRKNKEFIKSQNGKSLEDFLKEQSLLFSAINDNSHIPETETEKCIKAIVESVEVKSRTRFRKGPSEGVCIPLDSLQKKTKPATWKKRLRQAIKRIIGYFT